MQSQTKTVLITVKTYPNPSKKYVETVCCAGIEMPSNSWIRLYPITFRDLDESQKFKKYSIIEVKCTKSTDKRIESYRVDVDSIKIIDQLDTKDKWFRRKEIVLPTVSPSFCQITEGISENKSLGAFKPCDIEFSWSYVSKDNGKKREACYAQLSFFDEKKKAIEQIPLSPL